MRALILVAGAALAVSACSSNEAVNNTTNVDENMMTENVIANDTTVVDAANGADANMAADTNVSMNDTNMSHNMTTNNAM